MCGIFGYIGDDAINLKRSTDIITHRGPDAEGFLQYYSDDKRIIFNDAKTVLKNKRKVLFGFRRLAIIDLDKRSNQPISDETGDYHLIFNGEIYNHLDLKVEIDLFHLFFCNIDKIVCFICFFCNIG